MDPVSTTLLVSTALSLASSVAVPIFGLVKTAAVLPWKLRLLQKEIVVMRGVVDECYQTISDGPIESPRHVKELLYTTHKQGEEVEGRVVKMIHADRDLGWGILGRIVSIIRMMLLGLGQEKEADSEVAIFRDKVGLLRDACSEQVTSPA